MGKDHFVQQQLGLQSISHQFKGTLFFVGNYPLIQQEGSGSSQMKIDEVIPVGNCMMRLGEG